MLRAFAMPTGQLCCLILLAPCCTRAHFATTAPPLFVRGAATGILTILCADHVQLSGHSLQQWKDAKEVYGTLPFHTDTVVHGASKDEKRQLLKEKSRQRKAQEKQNSSQSKPSSLNPTPEPGSV